VVDIGSSVDEGVVGGLSAVIDSGLAAVEHDATITARTAVAATAVDVRLMHPD
jgi:hypothetical protein